MDRIILQDQGYLPEAISEHTLRKLIYLRALVSPEVESSLSAQV